MTKELKLCRIDQCNRTTRSQSESLCELHRGRLQRTGTTDEPPRAGSMRAQFEAIQRCQSHDAMHEGRCWEWPGPLNSNGYGVIAPSLKFGRSRLAHRVAFVVAHGREPTQLICHACDNPKCYRPAHLFEGTPADNSADMVRKGRGNRKPSWQRFGDDTIQELRRLVSEGMTQTGAAAVVGLSSSYASRLIRAERRG